MSEHQQAPEDQSSKKINGPLNLEAPLSEKVNHVLSLFSQVQDWEQKYEKIIELGKSHSGLADSDKIEDLKIKGCQSQVWIKAELKGDRLYLTGDSDALIVRGLVSIVLKVYHGSKISEVMAYDNEFLKTLGFDSGLSPSRTNGLMSMIKQIKYYGAAFQYLLSKK